MRRLYIIYIAIIISFFYSLNIQAKKSVAPPINKPELADSILQKTIALAAQYDKMVDEYEGKLYVKGWMNVRRKNFLLRYVPSMFKMEKGVREYIVEAMNEVHYTAPDIYDVKLEAVTGTMPSKNAISNQVLKLFRMNVYSPSLLTDKLYSPLAPQAQKYYTYYLDTITGPPGKEQLKVLIVPKYKNVQLVKGYVTLNNNSWTVREMYVEGELELLHFKVRVEMGEEGRQSLLPKQVEAETFFNFIGNKIDGNFSAHYKYDHIRLTDIDAKKKTEKSRYDLTEYFSLTLDSTTTFSDNEHFNQIRPIPLTSYQEELYRNFSQRKGAINQVEKIKTPTQIFFGGLSDILIGKHTLDMKEMGTFRLSPLIDPLSFSYSPSNGFSYKQQLGYQLNMRNNRWLKMVPRMGYNFSRNEFYWSLNNNFDYWPRKRANLNINFGSGNRIYSSDVLDEIQHLPDSIFNFDDLELNYFKDLYFEAEHQIEIINGIKLTAGIVAHRRTALKKLVLPPPPTDLPPPEEEVIETINELPSKYISFAPRVRLEATPGQYYYMNGNRKTNLYSRFPTFSVDWERGLKGVFGSTGEYERVEFDMQHVLRLGLMRHLSYRAGFGMFTNQEQLYFVDFANFSRNNLPVGWNDEIGGVFQLLDARWYNSSMQYARGHVTFEAPFLLLPPLMKRTSLIDNERLYLSVLFVPHLTPYIEMGYGIGTHIFDFGLFVNNINGRFNKVGVKFTFELFR